MSFGQPVAATGAVTGAACLLGIANSRWPDAILRHAKTLLTGITVRCRSPAQPQHTDDAHAKLMALDPDSLNNRPPPQLVAGDCIYIWACGFHTVLELERSGNSYFIGYMPTESIFNKVVSRLNSPLPTMVASCATNSSLILAFTAAISALKIPGPGNFVCPDPIFRAQLRAFKATQNVPDAPFVFSRTIQMSVVDDAAIAFARFNSVLAKFNTDDTKTNTASHGRFISSQNVLSDAYGAGNNCASAVASLFPDQLTPYWTLGHVSPVALVEKVEDTGDPLNSIISRFTRDILRRFASDSSAPGAALLAHQPPATAVELTPAPLELSATTTTSDAALAIIPKTTSDAMVESEFQVSPMAIPILAMQIYMYAQFVYYVAKLIYESQSQPGGRSKKSSRRRNRARSRVRSSRRRCTNARRFTYRQPRARRRAKKTTPNQERHLRRTYRRTRPTASSQ